MATEPSAASAGAEPGFSAATAEDILYHAFQARFLVQAVRKLARSNDVPDDCASFEIDPRTIVMAQAMRARQDGTGDACAPGRLSAGPALPFGATPLEFVRCLGGRRTNLASARGGPSWTDLRCGLFGWHGPPGVITQVVAGVALAFKQRSEKRAALVFEDWRAAETGAWHEAMSFAAAAAVPLVAVLAGDRSGRNGELGKHAPGLARIAANYGARTVTVGSESYQQIYREMREARAEVVSGRGPLLAGLIAASDDPWDRHEEHAADLVQASGIGPDRLRALERAAWAGVEHAAIRLQQEPNPRPTDALAPVTEDAGPLPPWTRHDAPNPGVRHSEPQGTSPEGWDWDAAASC